MEQWFVTKMVVLALVAWFAARGVFLTYRNRIGKRKVERFENLSALLYIALEKRGLKVEMWQANPITATIHFGFRHPDTSTFYGSVLRLSHGMPFASVEELAQRIYNHALKVGVGDTAVFNENLQVQEREL